MITRGKLMRFMLILNEGDDAAKIVDSPKNLYCFVKYSLGVKLSAFELHTVHNAALYYLLARENGTSLDAIYTRLEEILR